MPLALRADISALYFLGEHPFPLYILSINDLSRLAEGYAAYSPLESWIYAPFAILLNDLASVRLVSFASEFLILIMMITIGRSVVKEDELHKIVLIYILIPCTWIANILLAQDEVLIALFLLAITYLKLYSEEGFAAMMLGVAAVSSKMTILLALVPLILSSKEKIKVAAYALLPVFIIYMPVQLYIYLTHVKNPILAQMEFGPSLTINHLIANFWHEGFESHSTTIFLAVVFCIYSLFVYKIGILKQEVNFMDMTIVVFLSYLVFYCGWIRPEHYSIILPVILLRLAMLDAINGINTFALFSLYTSVAAWNLIYILREIVQYPALLQQAVQIHFVNILINSHQLLIGNNHLRIEENALALICIAISMAFLIYFMNHEKSSSSPS